MLAINETRQLAKETSARTATINSNNNNRNNRRGIRIPAQLSKWPTCQRREPGEKRRIRSKNEIEKMEGKNAQVKRRRREGRKRRKKEVKKETLNRNNRLHRLHICLPPFLPEYWDYWENRNSPPPPSLSSSPIHSGIRDLFSSLPPPPPPPILVLRKLVDSLVILSESLSIFDGDFPGTRGRGGGGGESRKNLLKPPPLILILILKNLPGSAKNLERIWGESLKAFIL